MPVLSSNVQQAGAPGALAAGLDVYAAALAAERDELHRAFAPLWRTISGTDFHNDMLDTLGAL